MTNADDANEVQENVLTVKKGKKRDIEAILDEEVAQRNRQRIPVDTRKATSREVSVWDDWVKEKNSLSVEKGKTTISWWYWREIYYSQYATWNLAFVQ